MTEWRRGWRVAVAAAIGMGVGVGLYAFLAGLFIGPLQAAFGWSRSDIAVATLFNIPVVVLLPVLGRLIDRYGARPIAMGALFLWTLCFLGLAAMTGEIWQYYVIHGAMALLGLATGVVVFTRPVAAWFDKRRGGALGFAIAGTSMTSIPLYMILQGVISAYGWRAGYLVLAALPVCVGLPIVWRWLHSGPGFVKTPGADLAAPPPGVALGAAARDARFWLLLAAMFAGNIPVGGILNQLQPLLHDRGVEVGLAAGLGSLFSAAVAVGRIGGGFLLDRLRPSLVVAFCLSAPILGAGLMLDPTPALWVAIFATATFGLAQGTEADFLAFFVARYFGVRFYATIYGALMAVASAGLALGAMMYAAAYDAFGDYGPALQAQMGLMGFSAVMLLLGERLHRRRRNQREAEPRPAAPLKMSEREA